MGMRRFGSVVAFVTLLLCALTFGSTELLSDEASSGSASPEMDQVTAKWLWINCNVDLMDMKRTVEGLDSCHSEDMPIYTVANDLEKQYLVKSKLGEVLSVLPPHLKQTLLGCLRKHNIVFHVSRKGGGYNGWYTEYLEYLFRWPDASRRYLSDVFSGIAVNPSSSSAPSPSPGISPPTYGPTPSADPPAPHFAAPSPRRLAEVPQSSFSSAKPPYVERVGSGQRNLTPAPAPAERNSSRTVVIAVVVTAGATIFVAVLLFCCYRKCRRNSSSTDGPKDESPLLSISFSDFSGVSGSSGHLGNSTSKERFGTIQFSTPSRNGRPSSLVTNISTESNVEKPSVTGAALISDPSTDSPALPDNTSSPVPHPPGKTAPPPPRPPPPPMPSGIKPGPRPPPPPMGNAPPRPPPFALKSKAPQPSPLGPNHSGSTGSASAESEAPKSKLKPFFWDKVLANPDQSMVWHQIKSGSFQFNEETIETLFGYNNVDKNKAQRAKDVLSQDPSTQYIQIIDSKKAQNLSILLRALNLTTEEVCDALYEGNELPLELCQTLLKMAPTSDEELKLRLYNGELTQLGPAERFLKVLINIPFAFKRMDSLSFMISYHEEVTILKESLATLEVACKELRSSRLFLKLLEAVLKTGNRMNNGTFRGGAQAFKLDTLLKLADVKGADGKTTLLHFVVQEIVRSEGVRAARAARENQSLSSVTSDDLSEDSLNETEEHYSNLGLQVVSCLGVELENVKKASVLDADALSGTVTKLDHALAKSREFLNTEMKSLEEDSSFHHTLQSFVQNAEVDITWLIEEEKRAVALVKKTADYFHGNAKTDEGLRLFVIVRNFLIMLDKTCKEVKESITRSTRMSRHPAVPPSSDGTQRLPPAAESPEKPPSQDIHQLLFPAIKDRRMDHSSSDDEDS